MLQNKPMSGAVAPVKPVPEPCDIHGLPPGVEVNHAKQVSSFSYDVDLDHYYESSQILLVSRGHVRT